MCDIFVDSCLFLGAGTEYVKRNEMSTEVTGKETERVKLIG